MRQSERYQCTGSISIATISHVRTPCCIESILPFLLFFFSFFHYFPCCSLFSPFSLSFNVFFSFPFLFTFSSFFFVLPFFLLCTFFTVFFFPFFLGLFSCFFFLFFCLFLSFSSSFFSVPFSVFLYFFLSVPFLFLFLPFCFSSFCSFWSFCFFSKKVVIQMDVEISAPIKIPGSHTTDVSVWELVCLRLEQHWSNISAQRRHFAPTLFGWSNISAQRRHSAPRELMFLSGSSWVFGWRNTSAPNMYLAHATLATRLKTTFSRRKIPPLLLCTGLGSPLNLRRCTACHPRSASR